MDDLLVEFLTETSESLDQLDVELVKLEQDPNDPALLSNIFRLVHTIKGTCGFLGLPRLESVAHAGENILGKFRDGAIEVNPDGVTLILECLDRIKELLGELERTEAEPEGNDKALIDRLNNYADTGGASAPAPSAEAPAEAPPEVPAEQPAAAGEAAAGEFPVVEPDEHGFVPVPANQTGETADDTPAVEPDEHGFVPVPADQTGQGMESVPEAAAAAPEDASAAEPAAAEPAEAEAAPPAAAAPEPQAAERQGSLF